MADTLPDLIDKVDSFEIVRDQIALLIFENSEAQQALAVTAGKDPALWALSVYLDRFNPWQDFLYEPEEATPDLTPIVNVWYETSGFDPKEGDVVERQTARGTYNIDVYGTAISSNVAGGGHLPGDEEASFAAARAVRLVRNILMSAQNVYLQLPRSIVGQRWTNSVTVFQHEMMDQAAQPIMGIRLSLSVRFSEFSPQWEGDTLELISVDVLRDEDGKLVAEADYPK